MQKVIDIAEKNVRTVVRGIAGGLHRISRGRIHPNDVTITSLIVHLPIAYLIATNHLAWAGVLLIVFGLFDTLDGELARLQDRVSDIGGLLDTVTDRVKELALYCGLLYLFAEGGQPTSLLLITMIACGASLITPFVKAKGEAIIATYGHELSYDRLNRIFKGGLLPYAVRILLIIIALLIGFPVLPWIITVIAIFAIITMCERLISIIRSIR